MKHYRSQILVFFSVIFFSCNIQLKVSIDKDGNQIENSSKIIKENTKEETYKGWWIYGEEQHIFKDEKTLKEYDLEFPNEQMEELVQLYLSVCEMEYFPMECDMKGYLKNDTLRVTNFDITYIQGCGE
jgi:hypothetical protein